MPNSQLPGFAALVVLSNQDAKNVTILPLYFLRGRIVATADQLAPKTLLQRQAVELHEALRDCKRSSIR
jgi:hypothetical protein